MPPGQDRAIAATSDEQADVFAPNAAEQDDSSGYGVSAAQRPTGYE
jgi:hypothetical protein